MNDYTKKALTNGRCRQGRRGFTLVEALVSVSILTICGSVLLLAVETSIKTTTDSRDRTIANGIARSLIDEVVGNRYHAFGSSPYRTFLGPSYWENRGLGRERFDDIDDYHQFNAQPVEDVWGTELGQADGLGGQRHSSLRLPEDYFATWRQEMEVYYVDADDPSVRLTGSATSDFRAVEVWIHRKHPDGSYEELSHVRRVVAYVSPPS